MVVDWFRPAAVALVSAGVMLVLGLTGPHSLPVLAVALVITTVLAAVSPVGGIGATVLTLPYFHHPIGTETFAFAPSELLLLTTLAGAGGWVSLSGLVSPSRTLRWLRQRIASLYRSPVLIAVAGITVLGAAALLHLYDSSGQAASLREWRWTLLEPMLLVGLLLAFGTHQSDRRVIVGCFLAGGLVAAVHGLADLLIGGGVDIGTVRRLDGPLPHPNAFALYLLRPTVFGISLLVLLRQFRLIWMIPAAIGAIALIGALSRAAFVAAAVAAAILSLRTGSRARLALAAAGAAGAAILLVVAGDRMMSAFSGGSLSLRFHIWDSALQMVRDRPVYGYGPDQFLYAYSPRYIAPEAWGERFTSHAHNLVIDFWIRLGIIGAVFAVGVVICCVYALARRVAYGMTANVVASAALITLVASFVQGMVDNGYFTHDLAMSGWLLAWLAFGHPQSDQMKGAGYLAYLGSWWRRIGGLTSMRQPHR